MRDRPHPASRLTGHALLCLSLGLAVGVACDAEPTDGARLSNHDGANGENGASDPSPTTFTCDPAQKRAVEQLRLLTTVQYTNTLGDLSAWVLGDAASGAAAMGDIASTVVQMEENLPAVPAADPMLAAMFPDGGYHREDQEQQLLRVQAYYAVGAALGAALTTAPRLAKVVGTCATDSDASNDASCLDGFIRKFGARTLRRPITDDDVALYQSVYGASKTANAAAYADVIALMLNAPEFVYLVEHGSAPVEGVAGTFALSSYELAARLSYQLWDTMPDDALWAAASDGSLLDDAVYAKQVDRLFSDPRAVKTFDRFFADYLQLNGNGGSRGKGGINHRGDFSAYLADPVFRSFVGANVPSTGLSQSMVDDAVGMVDYFVWTKPGTTSDLLTSELSFTKSPELAALYGVAPWDGKSAPAAFAQGTRPGLFTRAIVVANGANTNPIMKGVFLRRYVLCDAVGKPPPEAVGAAVVLEPNQTTRQAVAALTEPAQCAGCHKTMINPLGFATESFDGLGRLRTSQAMFRPDGTPAGTLPIDTSSVPRIDRLDDEATVSGAADLMKLIDGSRKFEACLTRNYFRHAFGRFEDLKVDGCTLESMRKKLDRAQGPGLLIDWLKQVVLTSAFKQRTFE